MTDYHFSLFVLFNIIVFFLLYIDLRATGKRHEAISTKSAAVWSAIWIGMALAFNLVILILLGREQAIAFLTAYVIEKSLSVDNIFVFIMIFAHFRIPNHLQPRILKWGILCALAMRAFFIFAGIGLIHSFHWIIYIFGGILIITGLKMVFKKDESEDEIETGFIFGFLKKRLSVTPELHGHHFFIKTPNGTLATPLFLALVVVEISDLVFAFDSIPAILAISTDLFIVYTSNIFAILGLRALFFLIAGVMGVFRYLKEGISLILVFVGTKMMIDDFYHIPTVTSLLVILMVLSIAVTLSLLLPGKDVR